MKPDPHALAEIPSNGSHAPCLQADWPPPSANPWRDSAFFWLTNHVARVSLTHAMGWLSRRRWPVLARAGVALWRRFGDLDLSDAATTRFDSLHDCFTRALKPGARPLDPRPEVLVSPCDAIVGACGPVREGQVWQAKGMPYGSAELFGDPARAAAFDGGCFVTLRLTAGMYHRFHAPHGGRVEQLTYISGDVWNVHPTALQRVPRLFCRNERAAIRLRLDAGPTIALVAVAAVMVASIRLNWLDNLRLHLRWRGPNELPCDHPVRKGEELGGFEHGSTIIVFAPPGVSLGEDIVPGRRLRMGEPLLSLDGVIDG